MINLLLNYSATIDIIALGFLLLLALFGLIQGFTKTFFTFFGSVIAIILAISLSSPLINIMQEKFNVVSTMSNNVSGLVNNIFGKNLMETKLSEATPNFLSNANISSVITYIILSVKNKGFATQEATIGDVICPTIAYYIVLLISVVVLYIIIKILFRIIWKIVKKAYKCKCVAKFDRFLGFALGLIYGIIVLELIILIIGILPFGFMQNLYSNIQNSSVASFVENLNVLGLFTSKIINTNIIELVLNMI